MLPRFAKGKFTPKNQEKYVGLKTPTYRSSWEHAFMRLCDEHPNVAKWASESIKIPYRHPFTGKYTVYVPDFLLFIKIKMENKHAELIEVKPKITNKHDLMLVKVKAKKKQVVINMAKWEAANAYAKQNKIRFRVVSEEQLFHNGKRK